MDKGKYTLEHQRRLDDLAGNNLNRPFDWNVENGHEQTDRTFTKEFEIH